MNRRDAGEFVFSFVLIFGLTFVAGVSVDSSTQAVSIAVFFPLPIFDVEVKGAKSVKHAGFEAEMYC